MENKATPHERAILKILADNPTATRSGFSRGLDPILRKGHGFSIIPDAYLLALDPPTIRVFEVEDKGPMRPYKMYEYCQLWLTLGALGCGLELFICSQWADDLHQIDMARRWENVQREMPVAPRAYRRPPKRSSYLTASNGWHQAVLRGEKAIFEL